VLTARRRTRVFTRPKNTVLHTPQMLLHPFAHRKLMAFSDPLPTPSRARGPLFGIQASEKQHSFPITSARRKRQRLSFDPFSKMPRPQPIDSLFAILCAEAFSIKASGFALPCHFYRTGVSFGAVPAGQLQLVFAPQIRVVLKWFEDLKQRVPVH
jgi:hypothetical protein